MAAAEVIQHHHQREHHEHGECDVEANVESLTRGKARFGMIVRHVISSAGFQSRARSGTERGN